MNRSIACVLLDYGISYVINVLVHDLIFTP